MRIITGKARGLKLTAPKNDLVRPTADRVKESLFSILGARISDATVLDLFAGTGNLGLEAWSRGARSVVFADKSRESLQLVRTNIAKCGAGEETEVFGGDALSVLGQLERRGRTFDFIFCDPPYNRGLIQPVLAKLAHCQLLNPGGLLIVEHAKHEEIAALFSGYSMERRAVYGETLLTFVLYTPTVV